MGKVTMKENISIRTASLSKGLSQHEIQLKLTERPRLVHKIFCCAVYGDSQQQSTVNMMRRSIDAPWLDLCSFCCTKLQ